MKKYKVNAHIRTSEGGMYQDHYMELSNPRDISDIKRKLQKNLPGSYRVIDITSVRPVRDKSTKIKESKMSLEDEIIREEIIHESILSFVWKAFLGAFIAQKALEYGSKKNAEAAAKKAYADALETPKLRKAAKNVKDAEDQLNQLVDELEKKYNIKFDKSVRMTK